MPANEITDDDVRKMTSKALEVFQRELSFKNKDIKFTIIRRAGEIALLFQVMIETGNTYQTYRLTPLLTFHENKAFSPKINFDRVAIHPEKKQYVIIPNEICDERIFRCNYNAIALPFKSATVCGVDILTGNSADSTCEFEQATVPFKFIRVEKGVVFSVPENSSLYTLCGDIMKTPSR